jgi:hypothetical protein
MIDVIGERFSRLTVIQELPRHIQPNGASLRMVLCKCDCGKDLRATIGNLRSGNTKSCGCHQVERAIEANTTHGNAPRKGRSRAYVIWFNMVARCGNEKSTSWPRYGAKGIRVCERWNEFQNFFDDMGDPPPSYSLERKDRLGDYSPQNCEWASRIAQARNTSTNVFVSLNGETKTIAEWAEIAGIKYDTLYRRIKQYGMSAEAAITTPVKASKQRDKEAA